MLVVDATIPMVDKTEVQCLAFVEVDLLHNLQQLGLKSPISDCID